MSKVINVTSYGATNVGPVRNNNEDNFFRNEMSYVMMDEDGVMRDKRVGLYLLCDGMGGHQKGEVASASAIQELKRLLLGFFLSPEAVMFDDFEELLSQALKQANDVVYNINIEEGIPEDARRMGSTGVAALYNNGRCYVAHVGDSRCYLVKGGKIYRLTEDHNYATYLLKSGIFKTREEAERAHQARALTQALGPYDSSTIQPDVTSFEIDEQACLILCSDGLTDVVSDQEIAGIASSEHGNPRKMTERLIKQAYKNGTHDNITVVVARFDIAGKKKR